MQKRGDLLAGVIKRFSRVNLRRTTPACMIRCVVKTLCGIAGLYKLLGTVHYFFFNTT